MDCKTLVYFLQVRNSPNGVFIPLDNQDVGDHSVEQQGKNKKQQKMADAKDYLAQVSNVQLQEFECMQ